MRLIYVSVICRFVNPRRTSQKIWGDFLYGVYTPGEWPWIDPNGKNGNYTSLKGYFGSTFSAICNHCGVMAAWGRKTLKNLRHFLLVLENDPLWIAPKICQGERPTMYSECSRCHQIDSLSAELQPNARTTPKSAVKWIQYSAEASLQAEYMYRPTSNAQLHCTMIYR